MAAALASLARFCALLPFFLAVATCLDVPTHGCYWTGCQSKWFGLCSAGHFVDSEADDCDGLCTGSKSPPCLPLHTHFYCCIPDTPKVADKCGHCKNKLDFGKEFICCSDCSDPTILNKDTKLGYCKSGAELRMKLKLQETFHWVAGPWMTCSSPCDGGIRYRDVACYGSLADDTIKHYPVDDASCLANEMVGEPPAFLIKERRPCGAQGSNPGLEGSQPAPQPLRYMRVRFSLFIHPASEEACNEQSCSDFEMTLSANSKRSGMSGWFLALVVLLGLAAVGGIACTSYTYYLRRTSGPSGFVYVMMDAYS